MYYEIQLFACAMIISHRLICSDTPSTHDVLLEWKTTWPFMGVMALLPEKDADKLGELQSQCAALDVPIFGGMVGNINTLLREVHLQLQSPPLYSGINAGSETFQPMPCLFNATQCVGDGVLGVFLPHEAHPVIRHAYPASKSLMRASSSLGNRVVSIDGRPAFEVYQEVIQREYGQVLTAANFYELAVHFPFGLVTALDIVVRIPVALGEDGSLVCVGEVPPDSMLHLLKAPTLEESSCVTEMVYAITERSPLPGIASLLTFYCAGRRLHFGDRAEEELSALQVETQCKEQFGALTLGEIDCEADLEFPRFHNAALVCFPQATPA